MVSGINRSRPPFGDVTCPSHSDRWMHIWRLAQVDVGPLERDHLPAPQACLAEGLLGVVGVSLLGAVGLSQAMSSTKPIGTTVIPSVLVSARACLN